MSRVRPAGPVPTGTASGVRHRTIGRRSRALSGAVPTGRRSAVLGIVLAVLSTFTVSVVTTVVGAPAASAAPGTPGVAQDPQVIYTEDFENRAAGSNVLLTDYTGATGATYRADTYWASREACNGFIIDRTSSRFAATDCLSRLQSFDALKAVPRALGILNGGTQANTNAAAASYTEGSTVANEIQFETVNPLTLSLAGRFITFSVDAGAQNCFATHPRLRFYLLGDEGAEIPVSSSAIDPCTDPRSTVVTTPNGAGVDTAVSVGHFAANGSTLVAGNTFGIRMRNENGSGSGNDGAYDNIQVLDVTPQLDKAFSPATAPAGGTSTLTFTITNTSELAAKDGWSFTDNLPAGLTIAAPAATSTCAAGAVTAPVGGTTLTASGNLNAGQTSCTVTVTVTSPTTGSFTNGPDNVTTSGLTPPGDATVRFVNPSIALVKSADPDTIAEVGDEITYSFLITNTGEVPLTDVTATETAFSGTGTPPAVTCPAGAASLAPAASVTCTATYTATQADVNTGRVTNTATATGTPPAGGTPPVSPPSTSTVAIPPAPGLTVVKSATPNTAADFTVGQEVIYSFLVTNTGNVTLTDIKVDDAEFTGSGDLSAITCPQTTLDSGASTTCTATYTLTQGDVDNGAVSNTATATGTPPGDTPPPVSPPSDITIPADRLPSLSLVKSATPATAGAPGQTITYSFLATNTGNVTLRDLAVDEGEFSGTGELSAITCPTTTLAPAATTTCTATYTLTQADVNTGSVTNTATATATPPGNLPKPVTPPSSSTVQIPPTPGITVAKSATPAEGGRAGEQITYSFLVTNTGNVTLTDVTVDEGEFTGTGELSAITCPATTLDAGASTTCTATYTLTQADVNTGSVTNTATATATPPGDTPPPVSPPSEVTLQIPPTPGITVVKSATPAEADKVGQKIAYSFLVTNTGNVTLTDVTVDEGEFSGTGDLSAITCPATTLAPSATTTCTASYTLTQADVDKGAVTNTATATGTPPGDTSPPVSPPGEVTIEIPAAPGITVVKSATPSTEADFVVGHQIGYSFLVTNTGNVTLTDVTVNEGEFTGSGELSAITCPATTLTPAATTTCTASYTLTQADVDNGSVTNTATATATPPGRTAPPVSPQSKVTVPGAPASGIAVVKTASKADVTAGDEITYSFAVTNTGTTTLTKVGVTEGAFSGTGALSAVSCPSTSAELAPGEQIVCTAKYVVTQADARSGGLTNTATASGFTPGGDEELTSAPSESKIAAHVVTPTVIDTGLASSGSGTNPAMIFGGSGLLLLLIIGGAVWFVVNRRRRLTGEPIQL